MSLLPTCKGTTCEPLATPLVSGWRCDISTSMKADIKRQNSVLCHSLHRWSSLNSALDPDVPSTKAFSSSLSFSFSNSQHSDPTSPPLGVSFSLLMGLIFFSSRLFLYVIFFFYCEYQEMTFIFYQRRGFGLFFVFFCLVADQDTDIWAGYKVLKEEERPLLLRNRETKTKKKSGGGKIKSWIGTILCAIKTIDRHEF